MRALLLAFIVSVALCTECLDPASLSLDLSSNIIGNASSSSGQFLFYLLSSNSSISACVLNCNGTFELLDSDAPCSDSSSPSTYNCGSLAQSSSSETYWWIQLSGDEVLLNYDCFQVPQSSLDSDTIWQYIAAGVSICLLLLCCRCCCCKKKKDRTTPVQRGIFSPGIQAVGQTSSRQKRVFKPQAMALTAANVMRVSLQPTPGSSFETYSPQRVAPVVHSEPSPYYSPRPPLVSQQQCETPRTQSKRSKRSSQTLRTPRHAPPGGGHQYSRHFVSQTFGDLPMDCDLSL